MPDTQDGEEEKSPTRVIRVGPLEYEIYGKTLVGSFFDSLNHIKEFDSDFYRIIFIVLPLSLLGVGLLFLSGSKFLPHSVFGFMLICTIVIAMVFYERITRPERFSNPK
jgi:hypothetical protein